MMSRTGETPTMDPVRPMTGDPASITDFSDFLGSMTAEAKEYVAAERAYVTLLLAKRASEVSRSVMGTFIKAMIIGAMVLFASIALAIFLGRLMNNAALGYLTVTGAYAVVLVVFIALWSGAAGERFKMNIINLLHGH